MGNETLYCQTTLRFLNKKKKRKKKEEGENKCESRSLGLNNLKFCSPQAFKKEDQRSAQHARHQPVFNKMA